MAMKFGPRHKGQDTVAYPFIARRVGLPLVIVSAAALRLGIVIGIVIICLVLVFVFVLSRLGSTMDSGGVRFRTFFRRGRIDWAEVASISVAQSRNMGSQIALNLRDGRVVKLPAPTSATGHFDDGLKRARELSAAARAAGPTPADGSVDVGIPGVTDLSEIGRGGFSTVFRGRQTQFDRVVAVKVLSTDLDDETNRRFERECAAAGNLSWHPNVVTVYGSGVTASGRPYLVMEYAPNGSLADRIRRSGALPWTEAVDVTVKIAGALEASHHVGRLHRDIKPDNILVNQAGEPMLADFGIAAVTDAAVTSVAASLAYAAPELLEGESSSVRSDVYSLAATCYALIAGTAPFGSDADSIGAVVGQIRTRRLPDARALGVPDPVCRVLEMACSRDPSERPESALAFAGELQRARADVGGDAVLPIVAPTSVVEDVVPPAPQKLASWPAPGETAGGTRIIGRREAADDSAEVATAVPSRGSRRGGRRNAVVLGAAAVAVVALVAVVVAVTRRHHSSSPLAGVSTETATTIDARSATSPPASTEPTTTSTSDTVGTAPAVIATEGSTTAPQSTTCPAADCSIPDSTAQILNGPLARLVPNPQWTCTLTAADELPQSSGGMWCYPPDAAPSPIVTGTGIWAFTDWDTATSTVADWASADGFTAADGACSGGGEGYDPGTPDSLTYLCEHDSSDGSAQLWILIEYSPDDVELQNYFRDDGDLATLEDHWTDV